MKPFKNQLLSRLPEADMALLKPHLTFIDLPLRTVVIHPDEPIENVVFLESGLGSEVTVIGGENQIEVGLIGQEGLIGLPVILGRPNSPHKTFMQIGGNGVRLSASGLQSAIDASATLRTSLLRYVHDFMLQLAQTALANGRYTIQARLARWLLMSNDRLPGDAVPLTHEFLGLMLGVRRAGVSEALAALEARHLLRSAKANIWITDRAGLEAVAASIYTPLHPDRILAEPL